MFGVSLFMCGFVCLVKSQNQFQQFQSYPYGTSYASIYSKQPIIVTPASSYNQVYTTVHPSIYPETPSVASYLQETHLNNILSNPAIQAFIDPGTKIYNQNGIEISDQVRPRTPNVVNNYFIVPTDYLKTNESQPFLKNTRHKNQNNYYKSCPKRHLRNEPVKSTREFKSDDNPRPRYRKNQQLNSQCKENGVGKKQKTLEDSEVILSDLGVRNNKQSDSFKREDKLSTRQRSEKSSRTSNNINYDDERLVTKKHKDRRLNDGLKAQYKSNLNECDEPFYLNEECCELDKRNPRNPVNKPLNKKSHTRSKNNQNDFMNNWMNYVKMFMPDQNNDSLDFSQINFPYNFDRMPNFNNIKPQVNKSNKRNKKRKEKEQQVLEISNKSDPTKQDKNKIVELSPKFIEVEDKKEPVKINKVTNLIPESSTETSEKVTNKQKTLLINSEISVEEVPIMYQNEIIDYYPDFKNDAIYTTDEDDLYFFHNRHYYNTEEALNRERRKFDRSEETSNQSGRKSGNNIPSYKKSNVKDKSEDQFRTPPGLSDPGFQTRKISVKDKTGFYSYHIDDKDSIDFIPVEKDDNSIETVYARSKVVKYGKPREVEKHKIDRDQENRNERHRNVYPKDGETTVVFSKAWIPEKSVN
ncbi:uncharacterized protein LOC123715189 [Pieris brassicae]|uniref:uncharacterized protein LOC123715189 n=1 Tax=Pieris brassicae TaxID=7116 RepID=UPI001E65E85D|nr:uncharacterized protein LOC123715189 [Pieris brassicae]